METDLSLSFVITVMKVGIAVLSMRRTIDKEKMVIYEGNLKTLQMPIFFFCVLRKKSKQETSTKQAAVAQ